MEGSGEFAGAVRCRNRASGIPLQGSPGFEETLKYVERANAICIDLAKAANFRAVMKGGTVFIRAEMGAYNPRSWTWDVFAQRLVELERTWEQWLECRKRGKPFKEPLKSPFTRPGDDLLGEADVSLTNVMKDPAGMQVPVMDLFHNATGYLWAKAVKDDQGCYKFSISCDGKWVRYRATKDEAYTIIHMGGSGEASHNELSNQLRVEVWTDQSDGHVLRYGMDRKSSKKNPLTGGTNSSQQPERVEPTPKQRCVVCGRCGRKGEVRKSGFKCTECIGIPSCLDKHPQPAHESHQPVRPISSLVIGDPDIARQLLVPSLPGHAS
eukprot:TRINITY_DN11480_c0_g2_i1.p1 TRINITY_DN11480_c0_g2~~TRINITY_DN11480_c0_g2_i1.p1  ORF type:complete len:324 (+),score=24.55 TRINITY_DN11480_c0_g2_i1:32-1003(+)